MYSMETFVLQAYLLKEEEEDGEVVASSADASDGFSVPFHVLQESFQQICVYRLLPPAVRSLGPREDCQGARLPTRQTQLIVSSFLSRCSPISDPLREYVSP